MAINNYKEFLKAYEQPKIDGLIVGFSGIDPAPIQNGTSSSSNIQQEIKNVLSGLALSIDCGVVS